MSNLFDLTGKKAIVTGASRGIGRSIAEGLHEMGAEVVIIGTNEKVHEVAKEIAATGGPAVYSEIGDMGDRANRPGLFQRCVDHLGGHLDILVNNAGINVRTHPTLEYTYEEFDRMMAVNVEGVFFFCQMAANLMLPQGKGKIINISSTAGLTGSKGATVYSTTKAAVVNMTRSLALELASKGIQVNSVAPGFTNTDLSEISRKNPERMKAVMARIAAPGIAEPDDMKGAVLFLASEASNYVCGCTIHVDGGALVNG